MIAEWCRGFVLICLCTIGSALPEPSIIDPAFLQRIANVSYATENTSPVPSIFSPRMDFDQWKPLTGRGDPLRNDPTYDYEPPLLERVHYWADDTRLERDRHPDRKSEVLMLGVSSRRPSVPPRQPPTPPRRYHRPTSSKYEEFSYKLNDDFPMTILVPPPPPPAGHHNYIFDTIEDKYPLPMPTKVPIIPPKLHHLKTSTSQPSHFTSSYALEEANLIYQSSTTSHNWASEINETVNKLTPNSAVSSEYAGWGPTTPLVETEFTNETYNIAIHNFKEHHPYSFYKPILSESPPQVIQPSTFTFIPTALPSADTSELTTTEKFNNAQEEITTHEQNLNQDQTTESITTHSSYYDVSQITQVPPSLEINVIDMLRPMMTMPMVNGPERPEDNLYSHASENLHIFKEFQNQENIELETMQTMQPPPVLEILESTAAAPSESFFNLHPQIINSLLHNNKITLDPYLHMRYTSPLPSKFMENDKSTTETPTPKYLIIQGHSKVKTYGSTNVQNDMDIISNEIPKRNETDEVKHLHPIRESKKLENKEWDRKNGAKNLQSLVDTGFGSIEIQEANVGIKYDVSDGSEVPIEVYKKGIVDSDENDYKKLGMKSTRPKRQLDLEDLVPFDEDTLEEYIYNFLNTRKNSTGITGLLSSAVTSDAVEAIDDLEDEIEEKDDSSNSDEKR